MLAAGGIDVPDAVPIVPATARVRVTVERRTAVTVEETEPNSTPLE